MTSTESPNGDLPGDGVELTLPAHPQYIRLARLAAADCGARAGLVMEDLEDLRIAVDELTLALIEDVENPASVTLRYSAIPGVVEVTGATTGDGSPVLADLARTIVTAVVDEFELEQRDGSRHFRLVKRKKD
ncbi:MAG TPA: hypothetical protein VFR41_01595 [Acidimicrobiia bacterium]|nr:hypothetical protein [Acidimicrobiia bacterium]